MPPGNDPHAENKSINSDYSHVILFEQISPVLLFVVYVNAAVAWNIDK